jgi:type II secretory pathway component GspD/PulD (secretin)
MKVTYISRLLISLLLLCGTLGTTLAADPLEVIQLQHRSAEDVIPILRPFLYERGALTGSGYQLIVRTTPENLEQLRDIIKRVDIAPRRLIITVKQSTDGSDSNSEVQVSGRAQIGSDVSIAAPDSGRGGTSIGYNDANTRLRTRVISTGSRNTDADTQQIQVLEGHEALIQVGQSVPVLDQSVTTIGRTPIVENQLAYKDVMRGFYVLPRVNGDQVTLDVSPYQDKLSQEQGGAVDVQRMHTTVSGRLGVWVEIGGSAQEETRQDSSYTHSAHTGSRDQRRVLLKVEEVRE